MKPIHYRPYPPGFTDRGGSGSVIWFRTCHCTNNVLHRTSLSWIIRTEFWISTTKSIPPKKISSCPSSTSFPRLTQSIWSPHLIFLLYFILPPKTCLGHKTSLSSTESYTLLKWITFMTVTLMTMVTSSFLGYHLYSAVTRMCTFGVVSSMLHASQPPAYQTQRKLILSQT